MNKTIDATLLTMGMLDAFLSAPNISAGILAALESAPAVEPAQGVPVFWASENILKESLRDNISCVLTTTKCAANTVPLYTVPPAIDDETRRMIVMLCESIIDADDLEVLADDVIDFDLPKQILEKLEAGK